MNLYFLLEGKRTEPKIYPKWLSHLLPNYSRVSSLNDLKNNNYFMISGRGYPSILNHIENSITDFRKFRNIDCLIISVDCDEDTPDKRSLTVRNKINEFKNEIDQEKVHIILQNRCIETWLLGNRKIFTHKPKGDDLKKYISHYNVNENDPEQMQKYSGFNTTSQFHIAYLKKTLNEKNISYTKNNPSDTAETYYLEQLINRVKETNHLNSFKSFLEVIDLFKDTTYNLNVR